MSIFSSGVFDHVNGGLDWLLHHLIAQMRVKIDAFDSLRDMKNLVTSHSADSMLMHAPDRDRFRVRQSADCRLRWLTTLHLGRAVVISRNNLPNDIGRLPHKRRWILFRRSILLPDRRKPVHPVGRAGGRPRDVHR